MIIPNKRYIGKFGISNLNIVEKTKEAASEAASYLFKELICTRPLMVLLPGGNSPQTLYKKLVESKIIWKDISIMSTDDRVVPFDSLYSNTRIIKNNLVDKIKSNIKPVLLDPYAKFDKDIKSGLFELKSILLKTPPEIAIIGMGKDGHIAGVFNENYHNKYCYDFKNKLDPYRRITISLNVFINTNHIIFYILGNSKKKMLTNILLKKREADLSPAKSLLKKNQGQKIIICDRESAPNDFSMGETVINY